MSLQVAIDRIPALAGRSEPGLQALGSNSQYVSPGDTRLCHRSLDVDAALAAQQPQANRWDYAIEYGGNLYFLEVHPASTGEVTVLLAKLRWLKNWLSGAGAPVDALPKGTASFRWAATGTIAILRGSQQARQLAQSGLKGPEKLVRLP